MRPPLFAFTVLAAVSILSAARAQPRSAKPVYRACPRDLVWSEPAGGCVCEGALRWDPATKSCSAACPPGKMQVAGAPPGTCAWLPRTCAAGKRWSELHDGCVVSCPAGKAANAAGTGCVPDPHGCPADTQWFESRGACLPFCAPGMSLDHAAATCVDAVDRPPAPAAPPASGSTARAPAPPPKPLPSSSSKPRATPTACPEGREWKSVFGGCVPICRDDEVLDFHGIGCHPIRPRR